MTFGNICSDLSDLTIETNYTLQSDLILASNMSGLSDLTILYLKVISDFSIKYVRFVRSDNCDILYLKVRSYVTKNYIKLELNNFIIMN